MKPSSTELCTMCSEQPAVTTHFAPVCQECADMLGELAGDLKTMEAADPDLAEKGRRVDEAFEAWLAKQPTTNSEDWP